MGRPKSVNIKSFHEYNLLHTTKVKMYSGVKITALYPIKETEQFYLSQEVWAYCASKFRMKKKNLPALTVDIPVITDEKTVQFLNDRCWPDWTKKERTNTEMQEAIALLKRVFPDKEAVFFYEIESIIGSYIQGSLIRYDENGNVEPVDERMLKNQKYYNSKYSRFINVPEVNAYRDRWTNATDEKLKAKYLDEYMDFENNWAFEHKNLIAEFIQIGENAVVFPVAFTDNTAEWSKEKYGKLVGYAHAGEIFFVTTADKVYFEVKRHY